MHASLYMNHHTDLNQCIQDAIGFEDNCNDVSRASSRAKNDARSTRDVSNQVDEIAKGVIEKMQQMFGPIRGQDQIRRPDRQFVCGQCGGNHPTSQCLPKPTYQKPEGRPALWCEFDKRWGNHTTEECYNCIRFMREQAINQGNPRVGELPKPVLTTCTSGSCSSKDVQS